MQVMKMPSETWAFLSRRSGLSGKEINKTLEDAFQELTEKIARAGIRTQGQPRAHFRYSDGAQVGFDIGFPIDPADEETALRAGLGAGETALGEALVHIHRGPYARLGEAYRHMERNMGEKGLKARGDLWEFYLNDPDECRASDLLTQIVWPVEQAAYA
jgi:AraC family transcriptional regulator